MLSLYLWRWACRDVVPWPPPIPLWSVCALDIVRSKHFFRVHEAPKSLHQFWRVLSPISMRLLQVSWRNSSFSAEVSQVFQLFGKWHLFNFFYGFIGKCRRTYSVCGKTDCVLLAWSLNDCRGWVCCVLCLVVYQWIGMILRWCCLWFCADFLGSWVCREINCDSQRMIPPENSISGGLFFGSVLSLSRSVLHEDVVPLCDVWWCDSHVVHVWVARRVSISPLCFLECICFCCCVCCVFIRDSSFQMFVKFICVGPHAMKTQFRTQPIWFGGVKYAFHMRYLSGQWASVVANCTLFGLLWWVFFLTFSWAFCTYGVCQFVSLVFQTVVPGVHNISVDDLSGALHLWGRFVVLAFWWILCVGEWLVNVVVIENLSFRYVGRTTANAVAQCMCPLDIPRSSFVWSRHVSKSWFPYNSSSQQSGWFSVESGRLRFIYFGECVAGVGQISTFSTKVSQVFQCLACDICPTVFG